MAAISIASGEGEHAVERTTLIGTPSIRVERLASTHRRPHSAKVTAAAGENLLLVNIKGTLLSTHVDHLKIQAVPPSSFAYFRGPTDSTLSLARGEHERMIVAWADGDAQALANWIIQEKRGAAGLLAIACQPQEPMGGSLVDRMSFLMKEDYPGREMDLWACVHCVLGRLITSDGQFLLANIPSNLPDSIVRLLSSVKKRPMAAWSLKEAADMAGYSPFHLSRTFKGMVGFGFPEFVDRCRTELAFDKLTTTDESIDEIASSCGFGSAHGLRESVKEYLGLLPSELRPSIHGSDGSDS